MLLRQRIENGDWRPGRQVPTLQELAAEFGVAVVTVRQALSILADEGLVWRRQGKGTFVADLTPDRHWIKLGTDWSGMLRVWATTEPKVLRARENQKLPEDAAPAGQPAADYRYLCRLHLSHDVPYALLNIYLDSEIWLSRSGPLRPSDDHYGA